MNAFTIKDVENLSGIQAHTIRIWEQRYSFLKPQRTQTNIRHYNNEELKTILNVALLNRFGFRISRISKMTGEEMAQKVLEITHIEAKYQHHINKMLHYMIDMELDEFDNTLTNIIDALGIKDVMIEVIFPFLERIGMLWTAGHINPAQEHFVSNIIRQKLLSATDNLPTPLHSNTKILLFLPEGELHEMGILFIQYLIKKQGLQNWYLGANVPVEDIVFVVQAKQPSYLYTHLTAVTQSFNLEKFIVHLHEAVPSIPIVISGSIVSGFTKELPSNVKFTKSPAEIFHFIDSLAA
jgi:MerR family transcriptional regulator, light-induced transcriptional regulator